MPVQDARSIEVSARGVARGEGGDEGPRQESSGMMAAAPRPAAIDAVRWGATLLTQLGVDPRALTPKRSAA
jgi:hypothetical protein